jgi:hypothetical protein
MSNSHWRHRCCAEAKPSDATLPAVAAAPKKSAATLPAVAAAPKTSALQPVRVVRSLDEVKEVKART